VGIVLRKKRFSGEADLVLSDLSALPDFVTAGRAEAALA
jgi:hypothetical protein